MKVRSRYSFFPVGQGTFSGGALELGDKNHSSFWWIYDCGCKEERQTQLTSEVDRLTHIVPAAGPGERPRLDLLFISHFDDDHVSGMVDLLLRFDVTTLVLPLVPLWKRTVLALFAPYVRSSSRNREFLLNPLEFIRRLDGAKVRQVYLVPKSISPSSSANVDPPADPTLIDATSLRPSQIIGTPLGPDYADITTAIGSQLPFTVQTLAPGARLMLGSFWEFVPYNDAKLSFKATSKFRAEAIQAGNALLTTTSSNHAVLIDDLRRIYDKTFGAKPKNRNEISLFVFAGPLGNYRLLQAASASFARAPIIPISTSTVSCEIGHCDSCAIAEVPTKLKTGILYTGDGYLKSARSFLALQSYLGKFRLANIRILQVMHHGSRSNWHLGLAAKMAPISSIYCADPKYYGHPHRAVQNDFNSYGPQLVDWKSGFTALQTLKW